MGLELASCIPPPLERPRNTRQASNAHRYSVSIANSRINSFDNCFFPYTSKLWNSLPESVFPDLYYLSSLKRQAYRHLRGGLNFFMLRNLFLVIFFLVFFLLG